MTEEAAKPDEDVELLLEHLRAARGFDFTGYKRPSLVRRIRKRMQAVGIDSFAAYRDHLEVQPLEFEALFDTILINVTSFFRDAEPWNYLATSVLPRLLGEKPDEEPIRVWSAGCASGEEAFSLAILLCDALGEERFRARVKIYGTDADEDALSAARHARYSESVVRSAMSPDQVERYFEASNGDLVFRSDLRRSVIFGRHDLVADPPISRVDLLACRNTLMYFNADTQRRILGNFHFALSHGGFLMLGKSEALVTRTNLFRIDDLKRHIFQKDGTARSRPALNLAHRQATPADPLLTASFDHSPLPQLLIAADGRIAAANRLARGSFGVGLSQIGRPLKDLEVSYRPTDLRSPVEEVMASRRPVVIQDVEHLPGTSTGEVFEVQVLPLEGERLGAVLVVFWPMGRYRQLRDDADRFQRELETTYEELQSTVEELETTNEELQSTNEELETTNEELHSTNEELETMNEELQSTNEELETINDELRERTHALDDLSSFLETILSSLASGVIVLDEQLGVTAWNRHAEDLWGLRGDEVNGEHFLNLDIGLPTAELLPSIRAGLAGEAEAQEVVLDAVNRRGKSIRCAVTISPLRSDGDAVDGVILTMDA